MTSVISDDNDNDNDNDNVDGYNYPNFDLHPILVKQGYTHITAMKRRRFVKDELFEYNDDNDLTRRRGNPDDWVIIRFPTPFMKHIHDDYYRPKTHFWNSYLIRLYCSFP
jgi:hypothetical protein